MSKEIRELINKVNNFGKTNHKNYYERLIQNNNRLTEIFTINEDVDVDVDKNQEALEKIKKGDFEPQDSNRFKTALNKSKHKEMLTDYSDSELSDMLLFKVNGLDIGFALKKSEQTGKHDEIVAVFNNEPNVRGVGDELIKQAIKNGGCYLDHFDGFLSTIYSRLGFIEYKRDMFNPEYDKDSSFRKKYGEADVIYRKHKNCK
jgi:hypothetical protein